MVSRRGIEQAIGIALLALLAFGCFLVLQPFLSAIVWAVVLSYSTWPLYSRLSAYLGGRRTLAAALMIVAIACVLVVPLAILGWSMTGDVVQLAAKMRNWFDHAIPAPPSWIGSIPLVGGRLSVRWQELTQAGVKFPELIAPHIATLRSLLLGVGSGLAHALFELLVSLVITFFLYCNGAAAGEVLGSIGERLTGERGRRLIAVVASTIRGVVEGLLGANLAQAILGALGFWLAGIPSAVLLGFFLFFLTVIPFGAGLIWIPAVLWLLDKGSIATAMLLAAWCIVVFPILESILRLYFMQRGNSLPALLVLLGMLGGLSAFGFLGIFLGPALLAFAYTLIEEWHISRSTPE